VPELPEVETVVRTLRPVIEGRKILAVRHGKKKLRQPWKPRWNDLIRDQRIQTIGRRGKWILLDLDDGYLVVHLGMTGRLQVVPREQPDEAHTHLAFQLASISNASSPEELRFRDPRRFGLVTHQTAQEMQELLNSGKLGPEPFDLTTEAFHAKLKGTKRCLKAVLLDQRVLAGVGNIYADEALFAAKLHPQRAGCDVTRAEANRLRKAIVTVLNRAIAKHGSTFLSFYYGDGSSGEYQNEFKAYQQTGRPCSRCRTVIQQVILAGRSTHFCPRCQE
jgi:formamidopyrimidine-DNA glycosylase